MRSKERIGTALRKAKVAYCNAAKEPKKPPVYVDISYE
jgi:hypothetical protein